MKRPLEEKPQRFTRRLTEFQGFPLGGGSVKTELINTGQCDLWPPQEGGAWQTHFPWDRCLILHLNECFIGCGGRHGETAGAASGGSVGRLHGPRALTPQPRQVLQPVCFLQHGLESNSSQGGGWGKRDDDDVNQNSRKFPTAL